jgi:endonuclease/exonuclease/phosphatase family metal-dependent hydrolase
MKLKLITYNIWHGTKLPELVEFFQTHKADVYCLQEVSVQGVAFDASQQINLFKEIETVIGVKGDYERMFWGNEKLGKYDMGVAIFSRFPVLERVTFTYEREVTETVMVADGDDRYNLPRKLLGNKLDLPGGRQLWVMTTHFTITPEATVTDWQLRSVDQLQGFLKDYPEFILTGDMNTPYGNETYRRLTEIMEDVSPHDRPTLHPTIHPVGQLNLHVDYVFLKGEKLKAEKREVLMVSASDHLPVVVDLEVDSL